MICNRDRFARVCVNTGYLVVHVASFPWSAIRHLIPIRLLYPLFSHGDKTDAVDTLLGSDNVKT